MTPGRTVRPPESPCKEDAMKAIVDFCLVPLGVGVSVSSYVAACEQILSEAGLKTQLHAYGTNIEGEWDTVFTAIKRCHEVVHAMGAPRISTIIKLGTRTDRDQGMADKVASVQAKLGKKEKAS
jgi:uncharacterized protein (TIGR00106 family)